MEPVLGLVVRQRVWRPSTAIARLDDRDLAPDFHKAPDFRKIDVDGRALDVLLGGMTMSRERRPVRPRRLAPSRQFG